MSLKIIEGPFHVSLRDKIAVEESEQTCRDRVCVIIHGHTLVFLGLGVLTSFVYVYITYFTGAVVPRSVLNKVVVFLGVCSVIGLCFNVRAFLVDLAPKKN